jgi:uncharacterized protein (DUF608 family)
MSRVRGRVLTGLLALLVTSAAQAGAYPMTPPRVYEGANLGYVAMPLGGIGTGTVWLDGQGRLAVWQVCNNAGEPRLPDSFFAIRAQPKGGTAVTRVLQTVAEAGLAPMQSLSYEGGYPIARLDFRDPELPVNVRLEAFNPMVPLDVARSSIPCALFRFTVTNTGDRASRVDLLGSLQNAVGFRPDQGVEGVKSAAYGGNRNRLVRGLGLTAVALDRPSGSELPGVFRVGKQGGTFTAAPGVVWQDWGRGANEELVSRALDGSGGLLLTGLANEDLAAAVELTQKRATSADRTVVLADFEGDDYAGWTADGDCFGDRPATGTLANQQTVSGSQGGGLVNTFSDGDGPQGELVSPPFTLDRGFISFLIGGGNHPGETCLNLRVDGRVVRTATGKDRELLEPTNWDVREFAGKQAVLEVVDHHSGGWGHLNVDQIALADVPLLSAPTALERVVAGFALTAANLRERTERRGGPVVLRGMVGKCRVVLRLGTPPWVETSRLLRTAAGRPLAADELLVPEVNGTGTLALGVFRDDATATNWTDPAALAARFAATGSLSRELPGSESPSGETVNAALSAALWLRPGEAQTVAFAITWRFPYVDRLGHLGNAYCNRWNDALGVAQDLAENHAGLWQATKLYHDTVYQSNLPEEFLDAMTSQSVIVRGPTCFQSADGYFAGFEGCYGCCPLNCTHVWNYAQTHARLFPALGRNMRVSDFVTYLHPDGETSHRQFAGTGAFIDGHCACIEGAYREYLLSPDLSFLRQVWPGVKQATNWMIAQFDADGDGIPTGHQWNTYDCAVSGANTFVGSQYLAALAAGEQMALAMDDGPSAGRWRGLRLTGSRNQDRQLWNGQYYIQKPGQPPANDYNVGCHADQLLGQWWAHQLGLGYLYPERKVRRAMAAVMRYNYRDSFAGFVQSPRRYVPDDEGGLLMCTWPNGGRPDPFVIYADEVWTGIEYATAGLMAAEGLWDEARQIVRTARGRYDGRKREGLNSGPGGNPFNELECGKFYARAMSSWGLLLVSQGQVLEGPRGVLGFRPRWQPQDHRSFFTAPAGWGLFVQRQEADRQTECLEVRWGRLAVRELVFAVPEGRQVAAATTTVGTDPVSARLRQVGTEVRLVLGQTTRVEAGEALRVALTW